VRKINYKIELLCENHMYGSSFIRNKGINDELLCENHMYGSLFIRNNSGLLPCDMCILRARQRASNILVLVSKTVNDKISSVLK